MQQREVVSVQRTGSSCCTDSDTWGKRVNCETSKQMTTAVRSTLPPSSPCFIQGPFGGNFPKHRNFPQEFSATPAVKVKIMSILVWHLLLNLCCFNHRLRGSASPVLTATAFVNGKGQYSTPHRIDTPQPITKNFVTCDYVGDPYGCAKLGAYPSAGGFWAHGWNITKIIFIYALFFEELTYRSDTATDFYAWWLKQRGLAQGCAFFVNFLHCSPFRGSKTLKTPILGRESRNWKTCIFSKLLHRFQPNFAQW